MKNSSLRNLNMLKLLCGEGFYNNLTFGTTCWSLVPYSKGVLRETELKSNMSFWKSMISKGARLERIPDDRANAQAVVYSIAAHDPVVLQTQREVVDLGKTFENLQVTQVVERELELETLKLRQEIEELKLTVNRRKKEKRDQNSA